MAWPCHSGTFPSLTSSVLSSDRGLGGAHFSTSPKCRVPLSSPMSPSLPLSSIRCLRPQLLGLLVPQSVCHLLGFPPLCRFPTSLIPLSPSFYYFNFPVSPLYSVHFSSVFCPCGKARLSAASCLTLLHLRPPSGPLVDSGVEPIETVSRPHSQAGGTAQALGCSWGASVFLPWASFSLKGHGGWWARGTGKEGQCQERRKQLF